MPASRNTVRPMLYKMGFREVIKTASLAEACLSGQCRHPLHVGLPHTSFLRQQLAMNGHCDL